MAPVTVSRNTLRAATSSLPRRLPACRRCRCVGAADRVTNVIGVIVMPSASLDRWRLGGRQQPTPRSEM
jgi:hypothetical protein